MQYILTEKELASVLSYTSPEYHKSEAIDLFKFSYYTGISVRDIMVLTEDNFIGNKLSYMRKMTSQEFIIPLSQEAMDLASTYRNRIKCGKYVFLNTTENRKLFPKDKRSPATSIDVIIRRQCMRTNFYLEKIGKELDLQMPLTTYVARNSCRHQLIRSGVPLDAIAELLGNSYKKTTPCSSLVKPEYNYREFMGYLVLKKK